MRIDHASRALHPLKIRAHLKQQMYVRTHTDIMRKTQCQSPLCILANKGNHSYQWKSSFWDGHSYFHRCCFSMAAKKLGLCLLMWYVKDAFTVQTPHSEQTSLHKTIYTGKRQREFSTFIWTWDMLYTSPLKTRRGTLDITSHMHYSHVVCYDIFTFSYHLDKDN
jgi:hypothetical protein